VFRGKNMLGSYRKWQHKKFLIFKNVQILNQQTFMLPYSPGAERQLAGLEPSTE
jgi:hypothetical protein